MNPYRTPGVVEKYDDIESEPHPVGLPCPANKSALPELMREEEFSYIAQTESKRPWWRKLMNAHAMVLQYNHKNCKVAICFRDVAWVFKSTWHMERELDQLYYELRNK